VHSSFRASLSAVPSLWVLLLLCAGCTERGDEPKSPQAAPSLQAPRSSEGIASTSAEVFPEGGRNDSPTAEAQPLGLADDKWPLAGEIDTGNRFLSVVDILTQVPMGSLGGDRRINRYKVTRLQEPGDGRILFHQPQRHEYKGDSGGACLRQTGEGFTLVGISSRGLGLEPAFTDIQAYRAWIAGELHQRARSRQ
jgi:hypothetical protein